MKLRTQLTALTMTTALVAAGSLWAQEDKSQNAPDLSAEAQPLDITTHVRAMHGISVVNHRGQPLGQLYDVVIDFSEKEVIYALMAAGGQEAWLEGQAPGEQAAESEGSESEQGGRQGLALYPIPIEAMRIVDRSTLQPQFAEGQQQTAQGQQQQMTEGQQPAEQGQQQMAEGQQPAAEGQQVAEGQQQPTAEGQQQQTAEGQQQMAGQAQQQRPQSLAEMTVGHVVGMTVVSDTGEAIADVDNVIIGADNQPLAVLGVGGFLGIGEKKMGVPLEQMSLAPEGDALVLPVTREQLEQAPELAYEESQAIPADQQVAGLLGGQQGQQQEQQQGQQATESQEGTTAESTTSGMTGSSGGELTSLQGKVLMVSIEAEKLQQAPSFEEGKFPEIADAEWQKSVLAFYEDLLGEERSIEVEVQTESDAKTEPSEESTAQ